MFEFQTFYENFNLNNSTLPLMVIIWGVCIGLAVAVLVHVFTKHFSAKLVKALTASECFSKDNAKALKELNIKPSSFLKSALTDGKTLRKYVCIANEEECVLPDKTPAFLAGVRKFFSGEDAPRKYDLEKAELYIPEDVRYTAEIRYEERKYDSLVAVISAVAFIILAIGLSLAFPKLLELWDEAITRFKNL